MSKYPFESALVTGASSGIGEEMVRQLAAAGVPTVVVARRAERLEALAEELDDIEVLTADLTTKKGIKEVAARIEDRDRPIDLVVNNAGFGSNGRFNQLDRARVGREVDLNVGALTHLSHAALQPMVERERGWLLNVSSVGSFQPFPGMAVYAATKAYVTSFSEAVHEEVKGKNVKVTALCPGVTRTEFMEVSGTGDDVSKLPEFLTTTVEEVAETGLNDCAKGRAISIPGAVYKAMVTGSSPMPRFLKRRMAGMFG